MTQTTTEPGSGASDVLYEISLWHGYDKTAEVIIRVMTKEEFERYYAAASGMTVGRLHELGLYAEPCDCGDATCAGWAMDWEHRAGRTGRG